MGEQGGERVSEEGGERLTGGHHEEGGGGRDGGAEAVPAEGVSEGHVAEQEVKRLGAPI